MNYFTIKRRLKVLNEFGENYIKWFQTIQRFDGSDFGDPKLRANVNSLIFEATLAVESLGLGTIVIYPSPLIGGPITRFHLIQNCLLLDQLSLENISPPLIIDEMIKAISIYNGKRVTAFLNTFFNPFYWLKCLLVFILKIPFSLLGIVVSEEFGRKAELSIYGKLIKSVIMLVIILLGTAADLNSFGLLRKIWSYVKGLLAVFTQ